MNRLTSTCRIWSGSMSAVRSGGIAHLQRDGRRAAAPPRAALSTSSRTLGPVPARRPVARQIQQVVDRLVRAADLAADAVEVLGDVAAAPPASAPRCWRSRIQRRLHRRQRIAQLVADAGGELADGGQALGVAVLCHQILAVGLEHDRELEVQDLMERGGDPLRPWPGRRPARSRITSSRRTRIRFMAVNMNACGSAMRTCMRPMRARSS